MEHRAWSMGHRAWSIGLEDRRQRTDDRGRTTEDRGQNFGFRIADVEIFYDFYGFYDLNDKLNF